MPSKRKTLPKNFEEVLKKGDLQELKEVFDTCEVDARGGYSKHIALAYDKCPHELAKWLIEQGVDVNAGDNYGNTPLHTRAYSIFGNIKSLLDLGADVNRLNKSKDTPLHAAASGHNPENTKLLVEDGAKTDLVNSNNNTALEEALMTCSNIDIVKTLLLSKIHLQAGAQITPKMKEYVKKIGKNFEFHRAGFNKNSVDEFSNALDGLYKIFGVEPIAKRAMHDGKSPISVKEKTWQKQHQELWELLVPSGGTAETIQGEVIRISGRITNELDGNGGINWDADFKKMADAFLAFVSQGHQLSSDELTETSTLITAIKSKSGDPERLCELAVKWVIKNPKPVKLPAVEYKR